MACWARCLGDCAGPLTKEHVISECLHEGQDVMVQGLLGAKINQPAWE
jgi:hypothetical protein